MVHKRDLDFDKRVFAQLVKRTQDTLKADIFKKHFRVEDLILKSQFNDERLLDITVDVHGGEATLSYHNLSYDNYSEIWPPKGLSAEQIGNDLFEILSAYLQKGATRHDKYVGSKLVSSTLEVEGADKTEAVKGFKLLGKRSVKKTQYPAPLDHIK